MTESRFQLVTASDVVDWGWDGPRLVEEMERLRWETIPGLEERHRADSTIWGEVLMNHPKTWCAISNEPEQVQGFWHFLSLRPDAYEQTIQGAIVSTDIRTEMIQDIAPGQHDLYLVTCCIQPSIRSMAVAFQLINSFWSRLIELAEDGVMIRQICTNAFTRNGNLMARAAGLDYVRDHQVAGQIYAASMTDIVLRPRVSQSTSQLMRRLREFY